MTFDPIPSVEQVLFGDVNGFVLPRDRFRVELHKVELALVT